MKSKNSKIIICCRYIFFSILSSYFLTCYEIFITCCIFILCYFIKLEADLWSNQIKHYSKKKIKELANYFYHLQIMFVYLISLFCMFQFQLEKINFFNIIYLFYKKLILKKACNITKKLNLFFSFLKELNKIN